jgi:hypothetical protein
VPTRRAEPCPRGEFGRARGTLHHSVSVGQINRWWDVVCRVWE